MSFAIWRHLATMRRIIWPRCPQGLVIYVYLRHNAIALITTPCLLARNLPGPCITNVFATRRKNFSQWHRSFQRKLLSHWLKFLRLVAITLVIQGPGVYVCVSRLLLISMWYVVYCYAKLCWGNSKESQVLSLLKQILVPWPFWC